MRRALLAMLGLAAALVAGPADGAQGDPMLAQQYALTQLRAPSAWSVTQGRGAVVAVVDTGVDLAHPDFRGRLVRGATFMECGANPCGNGDWRSGPASRRGNAYGHGTSVAGLVVAGRNNGVGIAGVAPLAKVMPLKIGDRLRFQPVDVARAIRWAVKHGADVINISLALNVEDVNEAVDDAAAAGVVVVAAAGNRTEPLCIYPAAQPSVICVTATDRNEVPGTYSSWGIKEGLRSVAAPGGAGPPGTAAPYLDPDCKERVVSTWPRGDTGVGYCLAVGGYRWLHGTSLASPHVAAVAALLVSQGRPAAEVVSVLLSTARTPGAGPGAWTPMWGYGIVDAAAAVRAPRG